MGMDVHGTNPTTEAGSYFRASIWGWRPLWGYCEDVAPELTARVEYGHSNDGDGLNDNNSKELAEVLREEIKSNRAAEYVTAREAEIAALPDRPCSCCDGTGLRSEPPNTGKGNILCHGCGGDPFGAVYDPNNPKHKPGTGKCRPWDASYHLDVDMIKEFAAFLDECGGFEIW